MTHSHGSIVMMVTLGCHSDDAIPWITGYVGVSIDDEGDTGKGCTCIALPGQAWRLALVWVVLVSR